MATDPYNLSFAEIARLTDYQIACVLSEPPRAKRQRTGNSLPAGYENYKAWFMDYWTKEGGLTAAQAEAKYTEDFPNAADARRS